MNCPICNDVRMREVQKENVMIDVCPDCKGVWLDRGELEKLMSLVRSERDSYNDWYQERERSSVRSDYDDRDRHYDSHQRPPYYKKKKKKNVFEMLGDIFD